MTDASPIPPLPSTKTSALAIWSLVLGCLGIVLLAVCIGPLFAIPGVICGHLAFSRIKRSGGGLTGRGLATGGLVTGYVGIALAFVLIPMMLAIAMPNFVRARQTAQQNFCVNNLRMIDAAKQSWAVEKQKTAEDTPTPEDLTPYLGGKTFASYKCPTGGTYSINKIGELPTCSNPGHRLPQR